MLSNQFKAPNFKHFIIMMVVLLSSQSLTSHQILSDIEQQNKQRSYEQENKSSGFSELNKKLQQLDDGFSNQFENYYTKQKIRSLKGKQQIGSYLFLLGKMHFYNILPKANNETIQFSYLLGYHYLKTAAQLYENAEAYYYLAVLQYLKLVPTIVLQTNLKENQKIFKYSPDLYNLYIQDLKIRHQHNIEHNLYLSSLLNHTPAALSLAYMLKQGIATTKNCTNALGYYLFALKNTKIDIFELPSQNKDTKVFSKKLYCRQKLQFQLDSKQANFDTSQNEILRDNLGNYDIQTLYQFGLNYFYGNNGYTIDYKKAFTILEFIKQQNTNANILIGFMYLHGKGTSKNTQKAREIFTMNNNQISYEILIGFDYLGIGLELQGKQLRRNKKINALETMQDIYEDHIEQKDEIQKDLISNSEPKQPNIIKTQLLKYLIGTLLISGDIQGEKKEGMYLIQSAAKTGNTLALSYMGLIFLEGSDLSYDCEKAVKYFSSQAYSHTFFQSKPIIAQKGLKKNNSMFSLIKYTEMMMIGYKNAFLNAYYLLQVYDFNQLGQEWSLSFAKHDKNYLFLLKNQMIHSLQQSLISQYRINDDKSINNRNLQTLIKSSRETVKQFLNYAKLKVITIGISQHSIKQLQMQKYKKNKDVYLLHSIANTKEQNNLYIREARYLLAKYYQYTNISGSTEQKRLERAKKEYYRATDDQLLGKIFYIVNANDSSFVKQLNIFEHAVIYTTIIVVAFIFCHWRRSYNLEKMLVLHQSKNKQQKIQQIRKKKQQIQIGEEIPLQRVNTNQLKQASMNQQKQINNNYTADIQRKFNQSAEISQKNHYD